MICLIYFSISQFNDNIKFRWRNLNSNDLMLLNLHIILITKRFFRSFDRHSDKTVTLSELLLDINNFSNKILDVIRKSHEFSFEIVRVITIVVSNQVNFLVNARLWRQSISSGYLMTSRFADILLLSPSSYILYTLKNAIFVMHCNIWTEYEFTDKHHIVCRPCYIEGWPVMQRWPVRSISICFQSCSSGAWYNEKFMASISWSVTLSETFLKLSRACLRVLLSCVMLSWRFKS